MAANNLIKPCLNLKEIFKKVFHLKDFCDNIEILFILCYTTRNEVSADAKTIIVNQTRIGQ